MSLMVTELSSRVVLRLHLVPFVVLAWHRLPSSFKSIIVFLAALTSASIFFGSGGTCSELFSVGTSSG